MFTEFICSSHTSSILFLLLLFKHFINEIDTSYGFFQLGHVKASSPEIKFLQVKLSIVYVSAAAVLL